VVGEQFATTQSDAISSELTEPGFGDEIKTSTQLIRDVIEISENSGTSECRVILLSVIADAA